jgi:uncharacterized protein (DUF885 family)
LDLFNTQLQDYSLSFHEHEKRKYRKELSYLQAFKNPKMSPTEKESYDTIQYYLNIHSQRELSEEFDFHNYLINQMMGAQSEIISFITKFHRILNFKDAQAYLIRVRFIFISNEFSLSLNRYEE